MQAHIFAWIQSTWLSEFARKSDWLFTTMETVHFMGLSLLLGSMAILDLRILGILKRIPVAKLLSLIPIAMVGFGVQLLSGITMFSATPAKYWGNLAFRIKLLLIGLAGLNALWFWIFEHRRMQTAAAREAINPAAKAVAALSLILWLLVLTFGRIITYLDGFELT
ncbi:MAG TPA: DUF6644 family protein [Steroidobacteraceae bacterium]